MRLLFAAASLALIASAATFACSSATPASTATADGGANTSSGAAASSGNTNTSSSSTSSSGAAGSDGGDDDSGAISEAGSTSDSGLVQGGDGGAACTATAFVEHEANDTAAAANTLPLAAFNNGISTTSFCGNVSATDVDFLTFTMPTSVHGFKVAVPSIIGGNVHISGTIGGNAFDVNNGDFPNFKVGDTWVVKIDGTQNASYDIEFTLCNNGQDCQ